MNLKSLAFDTMLSMGFRIERYKNNWHFDAGSHSFHPDHKIGIDIKNFFDNIDPFYENIKDQEILKDYAVKAKDAVDKYRGNFLVRGGNKITTEGKEFIRTVVIEFETFEIAKNFFYSDEYQSAHAILGDSVVRNHQIIEGA